MNGPDTERVNTPNNVEGQSSGDQSSRDALVGTILDGRFEIEAVLGTGGMSIVYRARQLRVNRLVAIKTLKMQLDTKPIIRERFQREISSLFSLNHPNIVTVHDILVGPGEQPYVVMDYLRGRSLEDLIKAEGRLTIERFARISLQICSALDHAHRRGIVHRDLKPGNVVLMDDDMDFAKVVDFGLAKMTEDSRQLTHTGELWGSPPYMSPEQCEGGGGDSRSDLYSLGAVMYGMLCGKDPFWYCSTIYELIKRHVETAPSSFRQIAPDADIPPGLEYVVFKAMEKDPCRRYQTAGELHEALLRAVAGDTPSGELIWHATSLAPRTASGASGPQESDGWFNGMLMAGDKWVENAPGASQGIADERENTDPSDFVDSSLGNIDRTAEQRYSSQRQIPAQSLRMDRAALQDPQAEFGQSETSIGDTRWHDRDRTLDSGHQMEAPTPAPGIDLSSVRQGASPVPDKSKDASNMAMKSSHVHDASNSQIGGVAPAANLRDKVSYHQYDQANKLYKVMIGLIVALGVMVVVAGYFIYDKLNKPSQAVLPAMTTDADKPDSTTKPTSSPVDSSPSSARSIAPSDASDTVAPTSKSSPDVPKARLKKAEPSIHRKAKPAPKPKARASKPQALKPAAKPQPAKKSGGGDVWTDLRKAQ